MLSMVCCATFGSHGCDVVLNPACTHGDLVLVPYSSSCELQVEGLEAAVESKDAELMALRKTLEHKEGQVHTAPLRDAACISLNIAKDEH